MHGDLYWFLKVLSTLNSLWKKFFYGLILTVPLGFGKKDLLNSTQWRIFKQIVYNSGILWESLSVYNMEYNQLFLKKTTFFDSLHPIACGWSFLWSLLLSISNSTVSEKKMALHEPLHSDALTTIGSFDWRINWLFIVFILSCSLKQLPWVILDEHGHSNAMSNRYSLISEVLFFFICPSSACA